MKYFIYSKYIKFINGDVQISVSLLILKSLFISISEDILSFPLLGVDISAVLTLTFSFIDLEHKSLGEIMLLPFICVDTFSNRNIVLRKLCFLS